MNKSFAVIFDMDGVLMDSNPFHKISLRLFAEKYGYQLSDEELRVKIYGRPNKDWIRRLFDQPMDDQQVAAYGEEKEELFRDIFKDDIAPVKGLINFLGTLKSSNIDMAIATSAPRSNVDFLFKHVNIANYFKIILDESDVERGKPDPEVYLKTAKRLGYSPDRCIVFEDSLSGVESALAAGCKVVAVTTTHQEDEFTGVSIAVADFNDTQLHNLGQLFD